jgi:hypothetical protein
MIGAHNARELTRLTEALRPEHPAFILYVTGSTNIGKSCLIETAISEARMSVAHHWDPFSPACSSTNGGVNVGVDSYFGEAHVNENENTKRSVLLLFDNVHEAARDDKTAVSNAVRAIQSVCDARPKVRDSVKVILTVDEDVLATECGPTAHVRLQNALLRTEERESVERFCPTHPSEDETLSYFSREIAQVCTFSRRVITIANTILTIEHDFKMACLTKKKSSLIEIERRVRKRLKSLSYAVNWERGVWKCARSLASMSVSSSSCSVRPPQRFPTFDSDGGSGSDSDADPLDQSNNSCRCPPGLSESELTIDGGDDERRAIDAVVSCVLVGRRLATKESGHDGGGVSLAETGRLLQKRAGLLRR